MIKKLVVAVFMFLFVLSVMGVSTYAWWNLSVLSRDESIVIGSGATIDVSLSDNTVGVLVPKDVALLEGQVNELVFEYAIELELPIIEGELYLEVWVDQVKFNGEASIDLESYLVFEIYENPMFPSVGSYDRVMDELNQTPTIFIRITLDMDSETPVSDVEAVKNSDIDFQVTFKVSDTNPN